MKVKIPGLIIISFLISSNVFSQCEAIIVNFPHGDCEGTDIELMAIPSTGGTGNTFQWTGPAGFSSNNQSVYIGSAPASFSGLYKVTITDLNGCTSSDSLMITKNPVPIVYTGGIAGGCLASVTYIYAQDFATNGPYSYLWDGGQTTQSIPITHSGGTYPAPACLVTNEFGCSAMNYTTFLIYTIPTPSAPVISASSATSFCKGESVLLMTNHDSTLNYQWRKGTIDIAGATNNSLTATTGGKYRLAVTNIMGCSALSNAINVKIYALPVATITVTGNTNLCNGDSALLQANIGTGLTYQWTRYNSNINGATATYYYAKQRGYYRVKVTNENGCSKTSGLKNITSNCREEIENNDKEDVSLNVYPNPSKDFFVVELNRLLESKSTQIMVSDITGKIIEQKNISDPENNIQIGNEWQAGVYFIEIIMNEKKLTQKIIKTE